MGTYRYTWNDDIEEYGTPLSDYFCAVCHQYIVGDDIADMHSTPDGEDCHAECCPACNKTHAPRGKENTP